MLMLLHVMAIEGNVLQNWLSVKLSPIELKSRFSGVFGLSPLSTCVARSLKVAISDLDWWVLEACTALDEFVAELRYYLGHGLSDQPGWIASGANDWVWRSYNVVSPITSQYSHQTRQFSYFCTFCFISPLCTSSTYHFNQNRPQTLPIMMEMMMIVPSI